jgi:Putative Flp pilus-assembly TadE/G-like
MKPRFLKRRSRYRDKERGSILATVVVTLGALIAISGLAIDLANLYVARSEVQKAADAAALAGATAFVTSGYTSGGTDETTATAQATAQATQFLNSNSVAVGTGGIAVNFAGSGGLANPQITVPVQRTVPLFFLAALGLGKANINGGTRNASVVAASATAEAYNPSGQSGGAAFCAGCLKPMMIANCDTNPAHNGSRNTSCPSVMDYFIDPNSGAIEYPQSSTSNGAIGEQIVLAYGASNPGGTPPTVGWYGVSIDGSGSVAEWPGDITSCNATLHTCTDMLQTVDVMGAGMIPAQETTSIDSLIHATAPGLGAGQDTITVPSAVNGALPYSITGGASNPNPAVQAQQITQSDSIATFPIYPGGPVTPGTQLTIIGFMQLFIQSIDGAGNITATILNISGCGTNGSAGSCGSTYGGGGSGPSGTVSGGGSSAVPVRLIAPGS